MTPYLTHVRDRDSHSFQPQRDSPRSYLTILSSASRRDRAIQSEALHESSRGGRLTQVLLMMSYMIRKKVTLQLLSATHLPIDTPPV